MKVVVNRCFGGFCVSEDVYKELGIAWDGFGGLYTYRKYSNMTTKDLRSDSVLITAIEKVGCEKASGRWAELEIVEVPEDVNWEIHEYDGSETIREVSRSW